MADTFTVNLNLTKPEEGSSENTWGAKLNANADTVDGLFQSGPALKVASGGTGATTASGARTNLGLGSIAVQGADSVAITGGTATLSNIVAQSTMPIISFIEDGASTNSGHWQFRADNNGFFLYTLNDGNSAAGIAFSVSRSGASVTYVDFYSTIRVNGYTVLHTNNITGVAISEGQITDGTVFPRLASSETVTGQWSFTTVPQKTSGGKFLHYNSSSYVGGAVTVSTGNPTGIPATGDRWVKYVA